MIITQTPLRISLAGGGTDFPDFYRAEEGAVLSTAIDKFVYVIVKERFDNQIYIGYSRKEICSHVDEIQHDLVREAMRKTGVTRGIEIAMMADIPSEGSGLGSSSSLTVGLLNALYLQQGITCPAEQLAREACEIEIDSLGRPIGKQDQYIAAYGGTRLFRFHRDGSVSSEPLPLDEARRQQISNQLLLFFTGRTRSSSGILQEQRDNIWRHLELLRKLRDQVPPTRACCLEGSLEELGPILHEGWHHKRQLAGSISSPFIDELYESALAAGATGGKIAGAGGGGFLLLHCPPTHQDAVRSRLNRLHELHFCLYRDGSKAIFNIRT